MKRVFSTFCHINDYEKAGYASLHRMIVSSFPLVLWGPSGRLLQTYYDKQICRISPQQFLTYVEKGFIRIIGRENWILDKNYRQNYPWEGGRWLDSFDDAIKSIYLNQETVPEDERIVSVVEGEDGPTW